MAERWQQWMPFHIDRWKGSPHVQAMRAAARAGYLYLLAAAWQTEDCCLPDDDEELLVLAGLTYEEWEQNGKTLRKRFVRGEGGLRNEVQFAEWNTAKLTFEKNHGPTLTAEELREAKSRAGKAGASKRWQTHGRPIAPAIKDDGKTMAGDGLQMTGTDTETKGLKTLASTAVAVPARGKLMGTLPLNDGTDFEVYEADVQGWTALYPAVDVRQELRNMKGWLLGSPKLRKTKTGIGRFIQSWLSRAQNSAKPEAASGRNHSKTAGNLDAAAQAIAFLEQADRDRQASDELLSEAGSGDEPGNLGDLRAGSIEV